MENNRYYIRVLILLVIVMALVGGCKEESQTNPVDSSITEIPPAVLCSTHIPYFQSDVWPVLETKCFSCHEIDKITSALNLVDDTFTDQLNINFTNVKNVAAKQDSQGRSLLLTKPANINNDHSGGMRITTESDEYQVLNQFVTKMSGCIDSVSSQQELDIDSPQQHLRKLTLSLASRLPTEQEKQSVAGAITDETRVAIMDNIANQLMNEESFFTRLKEIYNDLLLLDAFSGTSAVNNFDLNNFTNKDYFDTSSIDAFKKGDGSDFYSAADRNTIRAYANIGLAEAPLELIVHVVRNNRPFTEILTADYLLVNPYSATIFSANVNGEPGFGFQYGDAATLHDPNDFREVEITDMNSNLYPHAGILSTLTFLRRYPSTNTNVNRARSRYVFLYFLDTDVQGLADRAGLDLDNVMGNFPPFQDPQCKQCHDTVDPVAGLFKNWTNNGRYRGNITNWFSERNPQQMLKPGYSMQSSDQLPPENSGNALQWLAQRVVSDNRFALATVKTVFKGITGQELPQDASFSESLKSNLVDSNFNLKSLITAIINSHYFTVNNLSAAADPLDYSDLGMAHLLTPEQLHRKIQAIFPGYTWRSPSNRTLVDRNTYRLMYGGVDSVDITERTTDPTALISGIQERLAMEISCDVVPQEFNKPRVERVLFPVIDITDTPDTELGKLKIKQNIQYLHEYLLGETLSLDAEELMRTFNLFVGVRSLTPSGDISVDCDTNLNATNPVRKDVDLTVRPWMSVVSYLLLDYKFLYE